MLSPITKLLSGLVQNKAAQPRAHNNLVMSNVGMKCFKISIYMYMFYYIYIPYDSQ